MQDDSVSPEAHGPKKWRDDDPRRQRMAEKRAAILQAARPIVLRDGLGGTTVDRVAAEGGIAKMTLYRHFPNKEALFEGLVRAMCDEMRLALENAPKPDARAAASKRLTAELEGFTALLVSPDALALYRLLVADGRRFPALAHAFEQSGMAVIRQRIAELLETGGVPAAMSLRVSAEVVALALGDAYQRAVLGIAESANEKTFAQQIEAAVAHGLHVSRSPVGKAKAR